MDSSCKKIYSLHDVHAKNLFDLYFSPHVPYTVLRESTINMMQAIYNAFSTGLVSGRTLIDFSFGPITFHLLVMKDFVEEITLLELNDASLKELEKWKNKDSDGFDWSHASEFLQLTGISKESEDEEEILRGKIKKILKWDFSEDTNTPVDLLSLPKSDIATSIWNLEMISKDHEEYRRNLRKLSNLIKLGGYLLMYAAINCSYFNIAEDSFHHLPCDESFYRKLISEEGFEMVHFKKFDRRMLTDSVDHEGLVFIVAHKVKEP